MTAIMFSDIPSYRMRKNAENQNQGEGKTMSTKEACLKCPTSDPKVQDIPKKQQQNCKAVPVDKAVVLNALETDTQMKSTT